MQPSEDIWIFFSGLVKVNVSGMSTRALVQPSEDIVVGIRGHVLSNAAGGGHLDVLSVAS